MELRGKHVLVTGGAGGIGAALCRRFAAEGARAVVVADLDGERAAAVAAGIGPVAEGVAVDVREQAAIEALVARAEGAHGPIDLLCSNAGVLVLGSEQIPTEDWQRAWEVNVLAHVHAARAVLPAMLERGEGYLLQTCSAAGLLSQNGAAPYAVTKHAAVGFGEWLALTYGHRGIRVSLLCPQAVRTDMLGDFADGGVAGLDGVVEPDAVADCTVEGLADERFLILPHPQVAAYVQRKASDVERWLRGMQKLQQRFVDADGAGAGG